MRVACSSRIINYTHAQIVVMSNRYFVTSTASTGVLDYSCRVSFGETFLNFAHLLSMTISQAYQNFKKFYKTNFCSHYS